MRTGICPLRGTPVISVEMMDSLQPECLDNASEMRVNEESEGIDGISET
jgi:hypothetical protein